VDVEREHLPRIHLGCRRPKDLGGGGSGSPAAAERDREAGGGRSGRELAPADVVEILSDGNSSERKVVRGSACL
jgi:hypothetical protein